MKTLTDIFNAIPWGLVGYCCLALLGLLVVFGFLLIIAVVQTNTLHRQEREEREKIRVTLALRLLHIMTPLDRENISSDIPRLTWVPGSPANPDNPGTPGILKLYFHTEPPLTIRILPNQPLEYCLPDDISPDQFAMLLEDVYGALHRPISSPLPLIPELDRAPVIA